MALEHGNHSEESGCFQNGTSLGWDFAGFVSSNVLGAASQTASKFSLRSHNGWLQYPKWRDMVCHCLWKGGTSQAWDMVYCEKPSRLHGWSEPSRSDAWALWIV